MSKSILNKLIEESGKAFDDTIRKFKDIKDIGQNTTAILMSMLPELGKLRHKQIASLVGVVTYSKESGNTLYKSQYCGGRKAVRNA